MRPSKTSLTLYVIEFIISVCVGTLVGYVGLNAGFSEGLSMTMVAIATLLARDALTLVIGFGDYVAERRKTMYDGLWNFAMKRITKDKKDDQT